VPSGEALLPEENAAAVARRFGPSGVRFLRELSRRLADIAAGWDLALGEPLPIGIGGYLVLVRTAGGDGAVLKVSPTGDGAQDEANELEAYALRRWRGDGAVRLLAADPAAGALLVERCVPGHTIDTLADEQMLTVGCRLARRLHRSPDAEDENVLPDAVASAAKTALRLDEAMEEMGHPHSPHTERVVKRSYDEVCSADGAVVVCHGDTNPGNLLAGQRMNWLAVDPLPVRAPGAYDAVSLVWSKRAWLLAQPDPAAVLERRISLAAAAIGADAGDIRAWSLVRLVGLLIDRFSWGGYNEAPFVAVAELLCQAVDT
jgi:streptomycin 6-kinase